MLGPVEIEEAGLNCEGTEKVRWFQDCK